MPIGNPGNPDPLKFIEQAKKIKIQKKVSNSIVNILPKTYTENVRFTNNDNLKYKLYDLVYQISKIQKNLHCTDTEQRTLDDGNHEIGIKANETIYSSYLYNIEIIPPDTDQNGNILNTSTKFLDVTDEDEYTLITDPENSAYQNVQNNVIVNCTTLNSSFGDNIDNESNTTITVRVYSNDSGLVPLETGIYYFFENDIPEGDYNSAENIIDNFLPESSYPIFVNFVYTIYRGVTSTVKYDINNSYNKFTKYSYEFSTILPLISKDGGSTYKNLNYIGYCKLVNPRDGEICIKYSAPSGTGKHGLYNTKRYYIDLINCNASAYVTNEMGYIEQYLRLTYTGINIQLGNFDTKNIISHNPPPDNMYFSHWELNGKKISEGHQLTFSANMPVNGTLSASNNILQPIFTNQVINDANRKAIVTFSSYLDFNYEQKFCALISFPENISPDSIESATLVLDTYFSDDENFLIYNSNNTNPSVWIINDPIYDSNSQSSQVKLYPSQSSSATNTNLFCVIFTPSLNSDIYNIIKTNHLSPYCRVCVKLSNEYSKYTDEYGYIYSEVTRITPIGISF